MRHPVTDTDGGGALAHLLGDTMRQRLEAQILPPWIAARRWYAAKDAGPPQVRIDDVLPLGGAADAVLVIVAAGPPGGPEQRYLLPLALKRGHPADPAAVTELRLGGEPASLIDAMADDPFVRALAARMAEGTGATDPATGLTFQGAAGPAPGLAHPGLALDGPVARTGAEQSNTSVRIGSTMLKAFRKLEPGIHPELEMTRHLTERTGFANVPALLGSLIRIDGAGRPTAFCVLQRLVANQGDAWSWTLDRLADEGGDALRRLAQRLGERTAELHRALAAASDDPDFAPEPVDAAGVAEWGEAIRAQARQTMEALRTAAPILDAGTGAAVERLLGRVEALQERIAAWTPAHVEAARTRIHGDYHLGQVLVAADDVFIIDFEGEPMRPLDERRAKQTPLKDVAGMLRSFDYAGAAVAQAADDSERAARARRLADEMAEVFLAQYREAMAGCPSWPADRDHADRLLRLFLLEKALYEIRYEAANRPGWLATPVQGVLALLDAPPAGTSAGRSPPPAH